MTAAFRSMDGAFSHLVAAHFLREGGLEPGTVRERYDTAAEFGAA